MSELRDCNHENKKALYDHHVCLNCRAVLTDSDWGIASNSWFKNIEEAKFYKEKGYLPDQDGSRETIKPEVTLELVGGDWCACFKIGDQKFRLAPSEDKGDATWMCTQLEKAFKEVKII